MEERGGENEARWRCGFRDGTVSISILNGLDFCIQLCSHWTGGSHGDRHHPAGLLCGLQCLLVLSL